MELNKYIDHTLLRPDATFPEISKLCDQYVEHKFASVCVAPCWVEIIKPPITVCTVIGFPHGNVSEDDKENQARLALSDGAKELDFVLNIGYVKSGYWSLVEDELECISSLLGYRKAISKYIVEVGYLTDQELFTIADLLIKYKIDFIKTCTGYGPRNVTVDDIVKIKKHVGNAIKIKASGGIKTRDFAIQLVEAGADRLGTSSGVALINDTSAKETLNATRTTDVATY